MSSQRSIAGARQRRAGETPPVSGRNNSTLTTPSYLQPQQQTQQRQSPPQQRQSPTQAKFSPSLPTNVSSSSTSTSTSHSSPLQQGRLQGGPEQIGNGPGKLSVSDAFALVTLRLGRLETIINKMQHEGVLDSAGSFVGNVSSSGENIDASIVQSLVSRLEKLELANSMKQIQPQNLDSVVSKTELKEVETKLMKEVQKNQSSTELTKQLKQYEEDVSTLKYTVMKLQCFAMETNQKLVSLVMQTEESAVEELEQELQENENENENGEENDNEEYEKEDTKENILANVDLKELIKTELQFTDCSI